MKASSVKLPAAVPSADAVHLRGDARDRVENKLTAVMPDRLRVSRDERARRFGVDCPDSICWRHWTPGGEYIRKLIIKNTYDRLQVVRYNLPGQKATFFVDFPEPVTLSSGMHYELVIRFRPTELVEMHDSIEIIVEGRGSFMVDLDALTPYAKLTAPKKHDFAFCPVNATTSANITITNSGTVPLAIRWSVPEPFTIEPAEHHLNEGDTATITVHFHPTEATAVVAKAVCRRVDDDQCLLAVMMVSGVGKYCFLRSSDDLKQIDFGDVLTGHAETKVITLENRSCVAASFDVKRTDNDIVCPFTISPMKATVPPDGRQSLTIKYRPESTGAQYSSRFVLTCVGGNTLELNCFGTALGPSVTLSVRSLDFGDVDLDAGARVPDKYIVLKNRSATEVNFLFLGCEPGNAFAVSPFVGTLGPNKMQNISVSFRPNTPLNYLRRLHVLIKHSDKALHLDLLGTAFNSKMRPAPFSMKHVRYYHLRLNYGLGRITPEEIEKLLKQVDEGKAPEDAEEAAAREALLQAIQGSELDPPEAEKLLRAVECGKISSSLKPAFPRGTEPLNNVLPADERLHLPYSLEEPTVRFRYSALAEVKTVVVHNHTGTKATATWVLPRDPNSPWLITPETADIAALSSASFQLRLQAVTSQQNGTFGHTLECFVNHKSMRSFRLVSEATFTPSHCLTLHCQCVAHSGETSATPQAKIPTHVAFPSSHKDDCTFQVVPLNNLNDTNAAFDISIQAQLWRPKDRTVRPAEPQYDDQSPDADQEAMEAREVFMCYPSTGIIPPNGTALVLFRFKPLRLARYRGIAVVSFNDSSVGGRQILLRGQGFVPQVALDNGGVLCLRPTAVGGVTQRKYTIENPSRIPVKYSITVPEKLRDVLRIMPESGILLGCARVEVSARFTPPSQRRYEINVSVAVSAVDPPKGREPESKTQICRVVGDGVIGVVAMEPLHIDFGTVLVGADARRTFTIFNSSLCDVQYRLGWIGSRCDNAVGPAPPKLMFIQGDHGTLRARSHTNVDVSVTLSFRGAFEYKVYIMTHGSSATVDLTEPTLEDILRLPHCTCTVSGGHPTLEVTDVRCVYQRKSHLWRQMSVVQLNKMLREPVHDHDTETESFTFESASAGLEPLVCDLGVDTYRTAPIRVLMRLDNTGHCPVNFHFWLPHESEVPKEPWHQDPVKGEEDLHLAEIIDRGLFEISPRRGTVPASGHIVLTFTYAHTKVGQHTLPVILRLEKGKRILLHLTARTLSDTERYLAMHHSLTHELLPVAIGDLDPPLQYTELQNLCHHTVVYKVDSEAFADVREKNYDFPVIQCLNPQGTIPPMSTLLLSWYFRPLEAKRYTATIPISVEDGDVYPLTLIGEGYHPRKMSAKEIQAMHARDVFPLPTVPTLQHPMLPLRLSLDVLRFGPVPQHTLHRRVIVLENHHPKDAFIFEWHSALQYGDQLLDVDPSRGRIAPGESVRMRVSLYTGSTSHIIDNPIHCHILNEDLRRRRLARREARERDAAMQLDVPPAHDTVTTYSATQDSAVRDAARQTRKRDAPAASKTRLPITSIPPKFQSTNRLKQAIQALTEAAAAEELDDDDEDLTYVDVLPTVLEVLVQARIMSLESYTSVYGNSAVNRHYFPTFRAYATPVGIDAQRAMQPFDSEELFVARDVIDELLQKIVHHWSIQDAYCDVTEDPVPYFCQIREEASVEQDARAAPQALATTSPSRRSEEEDRQDGEVQCLVEEVLEGLLFDIISDTSSPDAPLRNMMLGSRARSRNGVTISSQSR